MSSYSYGNYSLLIVTSVDIQAIRKRLTYRFEDTIVWERWYFWRSEINIDYRMIQCIRGFCLSPLPIFKLSLQVPWIDSSEVRPVDITSRFATRLTCNKTNWYCVELHLFPFKFNQFHLLLNRGHLPWCDNVTSRSFF